ncbi:MAG: Ycf66 family protein [Cyanobacteria bacterium P01_D01_bin.105]
MLAITFISHLLAVLVGVGSVSFYMAAFFYPEVNRPRDIVWSGLGLVYAALLWFCAVQVTAAILLAQLIVVVLLGVLGWQTLSIRRQKTPVYQQTPVVITPEIAGNWAKNKLNQLRIAPAEPVPLKLKKRNLNEFSDEKLGLPIDPRRRPAYDYEFVEDGLWDEPGEAISNSDEMPLPVDVAPPSAIADVISVESPKVEEIQPEKLDVEPSKVDPETSELEASEPNTVTPDSADPDATESGVDPSLVDPSLLEAETLPASSLSSSETPAELDSDSNASTVDSAMDSAAVAEVQPEEAAIAQAQNDNNWDDSNWIAEPTNNTSAPSAQTPSAEKQASVPLPSQGLSTKAKPSMLAMPIILADWVKDVVAALTKPKPSKPVIEIPRREPAIAKPAPTTWDNQPEDTTPKDAAADSNWDD